MTETALPVTVVVVTFNATATIRGTLDTLQPAVERGLACCTLVDNASTDDTADCVADEYPWVSLIRSDKNLGFGRGCNLGFASVSTPYTLFLNPDAQIAADAIEELVAFMERCPEAGIVAPATLVNGASFQKVGLLTTPGRLVRSSLGFQHTGPLEKVVAFGDPPVETDWVAGGVMLMRTALFKELGGFDPRFFLYFEETDLVLRARRGGARIFATGNAHAYHEGGAAARATGAALFNNCISEHYFRSRYYYLVKNFGWLKATSAELAVALLEAFRFVRKMATGAPTENRNPFRRPFLKMPTPAD